MGADRNKILHSKGDNLILLTNVNFLNAEERTLIDLK